MVLDFYLHDAVAFRTRLRPALAASRRQRSFVPCRAVCEETIRSAQAPLPAESVVRRVLGELPYAKEFWHALVGELVHYGAVDMPLLQTAPETLRCLLAPHHPPTGEIVRAQFAPIQQAHFGSRDLVFAGGIYRPEHAGFNDEDDVTRLLAYLNGIEPQSWRAKMLTPLAELATCEDREEELAYVRDWWPSLVELYARAGRDRLTIVCEQY